MFAEMPRQKALGEELFAEAYFAERLSPSANLGKAFAELDFGLRRVFSPLGELVFSRSEYLSCLFGWLEVILI